MTLIFACPRYGHTILYIVVCRVGEQLLLNKKQLYVWSSPLQKFFFLMQTDEYGKQHMERRKSGFTEYR